jgi:hypothetical protein
MKDPNYIDTIFRVTANGSPIDTHENSFDTLEEALEYAKSLSFFSGWDYAIEQLTTITTIHDLDAQKNLI